MSFFRILFLLFLSIPLLEIYILLKVGSSIGAFPTVVLVVLTAVVGVWLIRLQGFATLARAQASIARGEVPAQTMLEGVMLFVAGALLLTPGFFTDTIGFIFLIPVSRQWIAHALLRRGLTSMTGGAFVREPFGDKTGSHQAEKEGHVSSRVIEGEFISHDDKK